MWAIPFTSPIQVQDIAAPLTHERFELLLALLMDQCQVDNKSTAKTIDLTPGDSDVLFTEFTLDLFSITTAHKQGLAYMHHDIKTKLSVWRYNRLKFFAVVSLFTMGTSELSDMGMKLTDGQ